MMNPVRFRNSGITCHLLYGGGGVLPAKDTPLVPLEKDDWQSRRPQSFTAEASLPNSQSSELDEDIDIDSQDSTSPLPSPTDSGPTDSLHRETQQILYSLFREQAGDMKGSAGNHKALNTLRRVGAEITDKHKLAFHGMLQKLSIQTEDDIQKLSEVPSMVFSDGVTNWGRIVTLISFGAYVAKHLKSIRLENSIRQLADNFTDYLMNQKREWIVQHNGWDGCVEFFHVEDYESGLRTVLMAFAGVAGLGASLAYMIR